LQKEESPTANASKTIDQNDSFSNNKGVNKEEINKERDRIKSIVSHRSSQPSITD
jgi:hypothetical protein